MSWESSKIAFTFLNCVTFFHQVHGNIFFSYLKTLLGTFNEMTNATIEELVPVADGKTVIPLKKYISKLATDIISKVMLQHRGLTLQVVN